MLVPRHPLDQRLFFVRVVHDGADGAKGWTEDLQAKRWIPLGGRDQNGPRGHRADAVVGVIVAIAEEDEVVVVRRMVSKVADKRRAGRALAVEPLELVVQRVGLIENPVGPLTEVVRITDPADPESTNRHAVDGVFAFRKLILPTDVVSGSRREDLNTRVASEPLGNVARVQLGSTIELRAIALNDDRQLHRSVGSWPSTDGDAIPD